jgi:hypothetical protein
MENALMYFWFLQIKNYRFFTKNANFQTQFLKEIFLRFQQLDLVPAGFFYCGVALLHFIFLQTTPTIIYIYHLILIKLPQPPTSDNVWISGGMQRTLYPITLLALGGVPKILNPKP